MFPDARITACDTDAEAIDIARENAKANDVSIDFRVGSIEDTTPSADLVCANLTADVISKILPDLIAVTCGKLILSGILETQIMTEGEITQDGEWVAIVI